MPPKPPSILLLSVLTAIGPAALHIITPALPLLALAFASPPATVQLVITLYLASIAVAQLFYGPISDRYGRRPTLMAGLLLFLGGTALCFVAWSLPALIIGRVLQAAGGCAGMVLGRAIVRDVYDRERATGAIAMITMVMALAPSFTPALGAYLAEWVDWRADFVVLAAVGLAALAATIAHLPETHLRRERLDLIGMLGSFGRLLRSPAFLGYSMSTACTSASWFTFTAGAPYLLSELLQAPPSTYGLMILWPMFAYVLGNGIAARYSLRLGVEPMLLIGLGISLFSGVMLILWPLWFGFTSWSIFIPMALSSVGNGMSQPPNMAGGLSVHPEIAGAASGLMGFLQMATAALGTILIMQLPRETEMPMLLVISGFLLVAFLLGLLPPGLVGRNRPGFLSRRVRVSG